ncbi:hypothetical protein HPB51_019078 [Rhipicephalus microplus]|uniref:Uncharacterized protein n=1 Tax=Rhipicephalus microplus TaxID=6941 RepID=A0A9J6D6Q2_RHIMP|nr:hypothetical protein HPB51_019078 [Rhipicephalus microplus]
MCAGRCSSILHSPPITAVAASRPCCARARGGEGLFLMLETALIAALVMRYRGQTSRVVGFTASYTCLLAMLMMKVVPVPVLWSAQLVSLPVIICGKVGRTATSRQLALSCIIPFPE